MELGGSSCKGWSLDPTGVRAGVLVLLLWWEGILGTRTMVSSETAKEEPGVNKSNQLYPPNKKNYF
jgi:hypothetical protein